MADEELEMHDDMHEEADSNSEEHKADSNDDSENTSESADDNLVSTSSAARDEIRQSMEDDVAAFLARGGQIQQIDDNVMADPPRKPQTNYGSRPI